MIKSLNFVVTFLTLLYEVSNSCVSMVIELNFYHFRRILLEMRLLHFNFVDI